HRASTMGHGSVPCEVSNAPDAGDACDGRFTHTEQGGECCHTTNLPLESCSRLSALRSMGARACDTQAINSSMPWSMERRGVKPKVRSILEMSPKQWRISPTR